MYSRVKWFTHFDGRRLEYVTATHMVGFGVFLLLPARSMSGSAGLQAAAGMLHEAEWGLLFLTLGLVNLWALHVNGRAAWTPFARLAATGMAMAAYVAMSAGFVTAAPWSPGTYNLLSLAFLFCGNSFLAASRDAGREISRLRHGGEGRD